jgi:hypothetical protein
MSVFSEYWSKIIVINLARRADRWEHFQGEMAKIGVGPGDYERFEAHDKPTGDAKGAGNFGCTASHRGVLELIAHNQWARTLVLEDDCEVLDPKNFTALWAHIETRIPDGWDMLYLGGHYGEAPQARLNPNILRTGRMLTTSSYAITWQMARRMAPFIGGTGPIDSLFGGFNRANKCFCFQPRLFAQYTNVSDIQNREMNNNMSMTDRFHESLMPYGYVGRIEDYVRPEPRVSAGRVVNPAQHIHNTVRTDSSHPFPTLPNL